MEVTFDSTVRLFFNKYSDQDPQLIWEKKKLVEFAEKNPTFFTRHFPFYKCFVYVYDRSDELVKSLCQFSTDDASTFASHLKKKHTAETYACFYCNEKSEKFTEAIPLIRHIVKKHGSRFFQCNNCSYRAITCEHVNIHQSMKHSTLNYKNSILFCLKTPHSSKHLRLKEFYDHSRVSKTNKSFYQCLFCSTVSVLRSDLFAHYVGEHPDYPMLYYHKAPLKADLVEVEVAINDVPKKFQKPSELIHEEPELFNEHDDDDDDFFTNDRAGCFFCSEWVSIKLLKAHLYEHLFGDSPRELDCKSLDDVFFFNWMNNFTNMQGAYFLEENEKDGDGFFHKQCQLCLKMSLDGDVSLFYSDHESKYSLRMQKIHFINHSSFKPFMCLPCERNGQGQFFLPDEKNTILKHLVLCHHPLMVSIGALKELCFFKNLYDLPEEEWESDIKPILIQESLVMEFSSRNEELFKIWKWENILALKTLEGKYYESIKKFNALIANYDLEVSMEREQVADKDDATEEISA
ncbi:hypothetical protein TYRP_006557 [Tyrophagus putrescentiae]|nr:hypothetical protein TYRP_006557 [Tyrophagus putrescentiae]